MSILSADETDKRLRKVSQSFCAAKWSQVLFNLQVGERHNCCLGPSQKIDPELIQKDPNHLFNDENLKLERQQMLDGQKIKGCNVCWTAEAQGHHSDRHFKSSAEWSQPFFEKENLSLENVTPTYVEVSFGNKCQMMCTYCSPNNSSSLAKESKKFGPYRLSQDHNWLDKNLENMFLDDNENHIYAKVFWDWFVNNYSSFQVMRFTGGEPLISKWMDKFLDWLKDNSMEHADLAFNSNLGIPTELMEKFIQKLKQIPRNHYKSLQFFTSLDGWGSGAELARYGLKLSIFEKNLNLLFDHFPTSLFRITATLNVFAFPDIKRLFEKVYEFKQRSQYSDQVAIVCYPIFYPNFLALDWTKDIYSKYYLESIDYISSHMAGMKNEYGFHEFEKEYFQKAVNFKDIDVRKDRYVDIFLYLKQFAFRKGLVSLSLPHDIQEMVQKGEEIVANSTFSDMNLGILVRSEPWIKDEEKRKKMRDYIFSEMLSGSHNMWEILGVHIDFIGKVLDESWLDLWLSHPKTRLGGFELLNQLCIKDKVRFEERMRKEVIKSIPLFDDYIANQVFNYCKQHRLSWNQEDRSAVISLEAQGLTARQSMIVELIKHI